MIEIFILTQLITLVIILIADSIANDEDYDEVITNKNLSHVRIFNKKKGISYALNFKR